MHHSNFNTFVTIYFAAGTLANISLFIIQAIKLYRVKDSSGLSFTTFLGFNIIQLSTILYGFIQQDRLLMYGYIATFIVCGFVTIMIPLYKKGHK